MLVQMIEMTIHKAMKLKTLEKRKFKRLVKILTYPKNFRTCLKEFQGQR
jgi:hypothetical protein